MAITGGILLVLTAGNHVATVPEIKITPVANKNKVISGLLKVMYWLNSILKPI
ncbi:MAG: hypothetical protein ACI936_004055, partial [Paraglaciecola sp.]